MRRWRKVALWVAAPLLLFAAYRFFGVYKIREGECHPPKPRVFHSTYPKRLRVMTYNIEGNAAIFKGDLIPEIAKVINEVKPDVVGLNEVHRDTWQSRFTDHLEELRRLTHMNGAYGPSYVFMGGAFGNAVLTRGKVVAADVHELPGTGEPRSVFETVIQIDGGTIELYVSHTAAWGSINSVVRHKQLECIAHHVQTSAYPFLLTGDLNAPPESKEMTSFTATTPVQMAGGPDLPPTQRVMKERIDYVFADRGWVVKSARVLDIGPSDHRPLVVELEHP